MRNTSLILVILALLAFASCAVPNIDKNTEGSAEQPHKVYYMGALKNIMHKGDLSAHASLSDFETTESLYALGAVEKLKGGGPNLRRQAVHLLRRRRIVKVRHHP